MSRNSVLEEFDINRLAVIHEACVAEHFEDESQMSQSQEVRWTKRQEKSCVVSIQMVI